MGRSIAAFDFDGTLTRRDSLLPFLVRVAGVRSVAAAVAAESRGLIAIAARRGDRDATKQRVLTRVLANRVHTTLAAAGREYGAHLASRMVTPDARERIAWHQREGHHVVIVSASLDVYLDEVARQLGVDQVVCTSLETAADGRCTGTMAGGNCRAEAKAARLRAALQPDDEIVWAYGDSSGDDAMLAMAVHPVRVKRGRFPGDVAGRV